jgi:toxin ParE1/3/4
VIPVNWTERAQVRLEEIRARIHEERPHEDGAQATVERLVRASLQLAELPNAGRRVPEYGREDVRELLVRPHRLIYTILPERIDVLTVMHYRQLLPGDLDNL